MGGAIDMTGRKIGRLLVMADAGTVRNGNSVIRTWKCLCACGKEKILRGPELRKQRTRSCGCLRREMTRKLFLKPAGESGFNTLFRDYEHSAKKRGYEFSLSKEQFREITQRPCFYCGNPPQRVKTSNGSQHSGYVCNGVDRMENSKGYTAENAAACCTACNFFKGSMSTGVFFDLVAKIYQHRADVDPHFIE